MRGTAFASDFDGTLCESDWNLGIEHYDPVDIDAIKRYQEAGGLFGVCTGRPLSSVQESLDSLLELDFFIVTTGARVLDGDLHPIYEATIDDAVVEALEARYHTDGMGFIVVTEDQFVTVGTSFSPGLDQVASLAEVEGDIYDVSLEYLGDTEAARAACEDVNARFGDKVSAFQNLGSVDIVPRGCSKGSGVDAVRSALDIVCAGGIGDSFNDLPLLEAADVAYTFNKAPQSVQDAADHVVDSVAEALAHFCDKGIGA